MPLHLLPFLFLLLLLLAVVQVGALTLAFDKLGLSPAGGFILLTASILGSLINLPLARIDTGRVEPLPRSWWAHGFLRHPPAFTGTTLVAVNVGGGLIPVAFSLYLLLTQPVSLGAALLAVAAVSLISFAFSRPVAGLGIGMPIFIAPVTAALVALLIDLEQAAPLAYIGGTLGVLVGADLLRLGDIRRLATPIASIGGAGTFDGIFITGIIAVLLT
ncbi:hypothetical protein TspCOW1_31950 [Thiohalobacter sp. COW1]|uniref:DUF1614 domain-containing protein n=1 Tax=Thiohalobacter thiocyanaticus TaxID=585455 RepID=A0A1Z4VUY1_9GAMM|nr:MULTISPECIES: DUF1614 domain-containing protein [Thiohalobacter]BAZ94994.1 uncharacterized protein FOKN1_2624 [Thiohalobacter thiocyanaticus]BCO33092.1 hypothetical protein TspCOW1_31950 [Thiohalobacter sp. COW1]